MWLGKYRLEKEKNNGQKRKNLYVDLAKYENEK